MNKLKIKKGDSVQVLTGKDAGKRGTVLRVVPTERRIVVETRPLSKSKHWRVAEIVEVAR